MDFTANGIAKYTKKLRDAGLSNDEITQQLNNKGFDAYEPPVSQRVNPAEYMQWRRASIASGAEPASDRPMIDQVANIENINTKNAGNPYLTKQRIAANDTKFSDINKSATESLYETNPEYSGQFGRGQIGAISGALLPIAAGYVIEKSHGSLNPISLPQAGAAELPEDIQRQKEEFNRAYIQKKFGK
jgi:hypothetical protein